MKVLLDESIDVSFRSRLIGHDVFTVTYMGWKSLKNGELLAKAVHEGFNALVTTDRAMATQLNLSVQSITVIILYAISNRLVHLDQLVPELLKVLNHLTPGTFVHVHP
jgi:hypothetical protein